MFPWAAITNDHKLGRNLFSQFWRLEAKRIMVLAGSCSFKGYLGDSVP